MRVVTWNMNRAAARRSSWDYLLTLAPDIALLQEFTELPAEVRAHFQVREQRPITKSDKPQRFCNAILVRGSLVRDLPLNASRVWAEAEMARFKSKLFAHQVTLPDGSHYNVLCVYSPAWPVAPDRLHGKDTEGIQLTQNKLVWVTDLLWDALKIALKSTSGPWIVAGDCNSSETFDTQRSMPRGNREFLDRMASIGLTECLRHSQGALVPTYKSVRGGLDHQIDHLWVTTDLASRLTHCATGSVQAVFEQPKRLSDHLPIIADFG